jgi:hypothetical protein
VPSLAKKIGNKIWLERAWDKKQLFLIDTCPDLNWNLNENLRNFRWVEIKEKFTGKSWNFGFPRNLASKLLFTPYWQKKSISIKRGSEIWISLEKGIQIDFLW